MSCAQLLQGFARVRNYVCSLHIPTAVAALVYEFRTFLIIPGFTPRLTAKTSQAPDFRFRRASSIRQHHHFGSVTF